jgi:hypothetical protein
VINSVSPEYRATLPASDDLYAQHDMNVWVNQTARISKGPFRAPRAQEQEVGAPRDSEKEIIAGLIGDLRGAAGNVASVLIAHIRRSANPSHPIAGLGNPTSSFENLNTAITSMIGVAALRGIDCPAMPTEISSWPTDMPPVQDGYDYLYEMLSRVRAWRDLTATPPVQTSTPAVQLPARVAVAGTPGSSVQVSWQPVGVGEQVAVRWQDEGGLWSSDKVDSGASKLMLPAALPGRTYKVQAQRLAAPVSGERRASAWTPLQTVTVPTGLEGARVARLELSQQGTDTTWEGRNVQINWSGIFPAVAGGSAAFATSAVPVTSPHMHGYGIRILTADGRLLREVGPVLETGYTYRYEDNLADSRAKGLPSASRALRFEVSILPKAGPAVGMQALTVTNAAPPKVGVVANAGVGLLSVEVTPVTDLDLDGYAIWVSDQPGFDPASMAPTYRGPSPQVVQRNLVLGNWYIRAAAVDLFQPRDGLDVAGLNLSDEVMVNLADITVDKVPPAVPTGLTLTSDIGFTSGREQVVTLTATWDRNGEADFLVYEGQIRRGEDGDWTDFSLGLPETGMPSHVWRVEAGTPYTVRLRGRDRSSNVSDYGDAVTIISAVDTTPPGPLSDVAADVGLRSVILRWTNPPDLDLDMVEVFRAAANDRAQSLRIGSVRGSVFADQGLSPGSTWHYWLRAVDRTGNTGDWSHGDTAGLAVAIPRATADDIADAQLNFAKFAQGIEPVGMVDTLPTPAGYTGPRTVMLTGDGKLYRLVANAWTAAVAAGDVAGQLAAHQIAADAIVAGKIAVGAVSAREIAAEAINADKIAAGAILADHITANSVRANHIQAGAVTADRISVANLAAVSADLGTITAGSLGVNVAYAGQIEAGQIKAGTVLSDTITVGGTALSAIRANASLGASDPAARINSGTTTIDGGKITTGSIDAAAIKAGSIDTSRLKVSGRILSILGLPITASGGTLTWGSGVIEWTDSNGLKQTTNIPNGSRGGINVGERLRLYWRPGDVSLTVTPNISINPPDDASILATVQPRSGGQQTLLFLHHQDVVIAGNNLKAGLVNANIIRADQVDAREMRMGVAYDGEPGLYFRTTDDYLSNQAGSRAGQKTIFAYAGSKRRAQMYVTADGTDAGFEAWDAAGNQIFGSNGFCTGSVDARVIRPESATFVRSCVATTYAEINVVIAGLNPGDRARVVLMAYGNGDGAEINTLLQVRGYGLNASWASNSGNYSGFKGDAQGAFMKSFELTANGTYGWQCWCSSGVSSQPWPSAAFDADIASKSTTRLPRDVGLIAFVSLR